MLRKERLNAMQYIPDWSEQPGPYDTDPVIDQDTIDDEKYHAMKDDMEEEPEDTGPSEQAV